MLDEARNLNVRFLVLGKLWRCLQSQASVDQERRRGEDLPNDVARRAEAEVPAGRPNPQAVRSPEYRETHWHLRSEAADHDRDGAGGGWIAADVLEEKFCDA